MLVKNINELIINFKITVETYRNIFMFRVTLKIIISQHLPNVKNNTMYREKLIKSINNNLLTPDICRVGKPAVIASLYSVYWLRFRS